MEIFDIVDESGEPTGETVDRKTAHSKGILHRTAHLWIIKETENGAKVLLQKRSKCKDSHPGCDDISSAGHIPAGFTYKESALRELKEELGLIGTENDLIFCGNRRIKYDDVFHGKPFFDNQVTKVFLTFMPHLEIGDVTVQEEEVESVRFMGLKECVDGVKNKSFNNCIAPEEIQMVYKKYCELLK